MSKITKSEKDILAIIVFQSACFDLAKAVCKHRHEFKDLFSVGKDDTLVGSVVFGKCDNGRSLAFILPHSGMEFIKF
jgi:hypothetical protein